MGLGGTEKHVIALASGLRDRGYETGIVCLFEEGALAGEVRSQGIPLICLNIPPRWGLRTMTALFRFVRSTPIDILHTYLFGFHLFAGLPARLLKVPVILSSRREIADWKKGRHRLVENWGNRFVDRVICCSEAARRWTMQTEKIRPVKLATIYNGVDTQRCKASREKSAVRSSLEIPPNAPLIGTVANFSPAKGYPTLLAAAGEILKQCPSAYFLFVGAGPLQKEMQEKASKLQGHDHIVFTGFRSDIPDLIAAMDIFVLASITEGFPNAILEAMAMGKPVVATRVGGIPEILQSGEEGVLVPPQDSAALAQAILFLLHDPKNASRLGARAAEKVRRDFTLVRMIDLHESLYLSQWQCRGHSGR